MRRLIVGLFALVLLGCADNAGPGGVPDADLHIVEQDSLTPPLVASQASFWAKVGEGREIRLFYQVTPADSDEFLRFEVPGDGLLRKPHGTAFQQGDSILITVTVLDPKRFSFQFEPSGLVFNPEHPARLKVRYFGCEHDFNGDGVEDAADTVIEQELDLWRREGPGAPWFRMGAVKFEELDELDANIGSFTEHAVAW
ncbi:MAG TPA: hypothetical protein VGQ06_15050 [Gemmatimonadales bacterium]|jgi:hypothetical protein|nr:hypothetical protein [Gemmatimonadales bacterium]